MGKVVAGLYGCFAGLQASISAAGLLNYYNEKATVMQTYLANAPELTDKVFQAAQNASHQFVSSDKNLSGALLIACGAGLFGALSVYEACKKK